MGVTLEIKSQRELSQLESAFHHFRTTRVLFEEHRRIDHGRATRRGQDRRGRQRGDGVLAQRMAQHQQTIGIAVFVH